MRINRIKDRPELDLIQFTNNNVTLSIGYGTGHYCDGHLREPSLKDTGTIEVAVWREDGNLEQIGNDTVAGYVPVEILPHLLSLLKDHPAAEKEIARYLSERNF